MTFSISQFSAEVNKHGVAKSNLFVARITPPQGLVPEDTTMEPQTLTFLCSAASLPPVTIETQQFKPRGFGPSELRPNGFELTPLNTIFMVDGRFGVMRFFHQWMQQIVNYDVSGGYFSESPTALLPYEFGYRDDYAGTMEIIMFSGNDGQNQYTYKFNNVYPVSVGGIEVAWQNGAEVMTVPISFAYDELKVDGTFQGVATTRFNRANGVFTYLSSLNTIGNAIQGLQFPQDITDIVNVVANANDIFGQLY
jgi:hypothetical protein